MENKNLDIQAKFEDKNFKYSLELKVGNNKNITTLITERQGKNNMILYTKDLIGNISAWKIVDGKVWDMLTESKREIISYNGGWVLVEKI